jgi:hypothetical protein
VEDLQAILAEHGRRRAGQGDRGDSKASRGESSIQVYLK